MGMDIKGIGSAIRREADSDEAQTTVHAKSELPGASLTVSVDPEGEVDLTFCRRFEEASVMIHGREAMVDAGGMLRFYRMDEGMAGLAGIAAADAKLIQGAKEMLDEVLGVIEADDFERFNPFEEETR